VAYELTSVTVSCMYRSHPILARPSRRPYRSSAVAVPAVLTILLAGCSGGSQGQSDPADSAAMLTRARASLDHTSTVHFTLTSTNVPTTGTRLVTGEGVIARPAQFQGTLAILFNGNKVSVGLISAGGKVYAKLPFSNDYQVTNPASFGLSDPAKLIDSTTGISRMFGEFTGVTNKGEQRIGDDVVTELDGSLPGPLVDDLLTDADPAQPVQAQLFITKSGNQLRRVALTGPFFEKGQDSTFNLLLDRYGDPVTITAPSVG
jgi:LppX_LprAFG lipoprotein